MPSRPRVGTLFAFAMILGGLLLFANTQFTNVLPDPGRTEFIQDQPKGEAIGDPTFLILSGLIMTVGALVLVGTRSPATGWRKGLAMTVFGGSLFVFLIINFSLFINGVAVTTNTDRAIYFTASYLFHSGELLSFVGVYLIFLSMLVLVGLLLGSLAYLLVPSRIGKALWDRNDWAKNEAIHIATSLLLALSLSILFVYVLRVTVDADMGAMRTRGLLAQNVVVSLYYVYILILFFLVLTIAAHAFLVNWGTHTPLERGELLKSVSNVARVERTLWWASVGINVLMLLLPWALVSRFDLSNDPVFLITPKALSWFYFLLLVPYVPYAASQRRLERLLRTGHPLAGQTPFSSQSLKLVQQFLAGIVLVTVVALAADWQPLTLMLAFAGWTAAVLLWHAIRIELRDAIPAPSFRSGAGSVLYFAFLALALTTGLMLWGAGNTFEVRYLESTRTLEFLNEADLGQDLAARVGAVAILSGSLVLSLHLLSRAVGVQRRFLGHYIWMFIVSTVAASATFTVGVWTQGPQGVQDAYAGFAFRQYVGPEQFLVGLLLSGAIVGLFWSLGRILREILARSAPPKAPRGTIPTTAV